MTDNGEMKKNYPMSKQSCRQICQSNKSIVPTFSQVAVTLSMICWGWVSISHFWGRCTKKQKHGTIQITITCTRWLPSSLIFIAARGPPIMAQELIRHTKPQFHHDSSVTAFQHSTDFQMKNLECEGTDSSNSTVNWASYCSALTLIPWLIHHQWRT